MNCVDSISNEHVRRVIFKFKYATEKEGNLHERSIMEDMTLTNKKTL